MYLQILSFVSKVHQVVLPEDAVDYGSVTLEQVDDVHACFATRLRSSTMIQPP